MMKKNSSIQTFIIFCLEEYKNKKEMSGKNALNDFVNYNVFEFLESSFDILHSQSMNYIIDEINEFINNQK